MAIELDPRMDNVTSKDGKSARDALVALAQKKGWHMKCGGSVVPHIQFRSTADERPYSYALALNQITPMFYVRRPTEPERSTLLADYEGAHLNPSREVKIPVPDKATAIRVAAQFMT